MATLLALFTGSGAWAAEVALEERLDALVEAYDAIERHDGRYLYLKDDGPPILIDDGREKSHQEKLKSADVEDMLSQVYPLGRCGMPPARNADPGRIRDEALMRRLFGNSKKEVRASTRAVPWLRGKVRFTRAAGADEALERVAKDLAELPAEVRRPALKSNGTFVWRPIAGTKRLSVHSFAAAIDLDIKYADYWRWAKPRPKPGKVSEYKNRMPLEIVEVFERHGFIWGGKWYHYDTMHFEYRPEMIAIGRLTGEGC